MELHSKYVFPYIPQTLIGIVIHIDKCRDSYLRIKALWIHCIAMILRGNVHPAGIQILHRMISSAMTVFQFISICPNSQRHQLMAQANGKNRYLRFIKPANLTNHFRILFRVAGTIGKHDSIRLCRQNLLCWGMAGINRHQTPPLRQRTCDISLGAQIQKGHSFPLAGTSLHRLCLPGRAHGNRQSSRITGLHHIRFLAGNCLHHASDPITLNSFHGFCIIIVSMSGDHAIHGAFFS